MVKSNSVAVSGAFTFCRQIPIAGRFEKAWKIFFRKTVLFVRLTFQKMSSDADLRKRFFRPRRIKSYVRKNFRKGLDKDEIYDKIYL